MNTVNFQELRNYMMFRDLPDEALMQLSHYCQYRELLAGETLFEQNDAGDALYLLDAGQIHIIRQYPDGEQVILATEGPYYAIGDLSMLVNNPRSGAVVAVSDCVLLRISREAFFELCAEIPDVAVKVLSHLAGRLHRLNLKVREYAISNVAARIASMLLLISGDTSGEIKTRIRVSRIARAIATDADTVERILREWHDAGYITYSSGEMHLNDIEKIRDIAG